MWVNQFLIQNKIFLTNLLVYKNNVYCVYQFFTTLTFKRIHQEGTLLLLLWLNGY